MIRACVRAFLGVFFFGVLVGAAHAGGGLRITACRTSSSYGDSTFVGFPNGRNLLVDGGSNDTAGVPTDYHWVQQFLDTAVGFGGTIWYMHLSHPHADHWNGLDTAMNRYVIMRYYSSFPENDSPASSLSPTGYSYFTALLNTEFSSPYTLSANCLEIIATGNSATTAKVSGPGANLGPGWDLSVDALVTSGEEMSGDSGPNSNSVEFHVWYGSNTWLSGGDMTGFGSSEGDIEATETTNYGGVGRRIYQNVELYKMHHHGANTSNSASFLSVISPSDPRQRLLYVCAGGTGTTDASNLSGAALDRAKAEQRKRYRPDLDGPMRFAAAGDGEWGFARTYVYPEGGTTSFRSHSVTPPGPPALPAATTSGANVNLSWTASTPGTKLLKEYWIFRATVPGGGGIPVETQPGVDPPASYWRSGSVLGIYKRIAVVAAPGTNHQDVLAPGSTLYFYRIKAADEYYSESEYSVEFTTDVVLPSTPTALTVASGGSDGVGAFLNLTWTANTETDVWDYRVYRATYASGSYSTGALTTAVLAPGTTHRDPGLGNGSTYYYNLTVRDTSGNESGPTAEMSGVFRDSAAPGTPVGLGMADVPADQGNGLNVSWTANTETDLRDYRLYRSTNTGVTQVSSHVVTAVAAPGTTRQDGGLSPGVTYYYRLSARDGVLNESGLSAEPSAYPADNLAPAAPSGVGVSDPGTTVLNLSWAANTETDLKDYRIHRSTNMGVVIGGTQTVVPAAIAAPGTTCQDGGLTAGARYNYRITARDTSLNESGGSLSEPFGIPGPPAAPAGLAVSSVVATGQRLNLTWTANTEGDLKDYRVRRTTFVGVGIADPVVATVLIPGTTHQDGGLGNGTTYFYRLAARDTSLNESGLSSEVSGVPQDTTPPAAPTGLGAANPGIGLRLNLSWAANTETDLKDYRVFRSTNAGVTQVSTHVVTAVNAPGTTNQDGGLANGTTYFYRLSARDASLNESGLSSESSGTPTDTTPPAVPVGLVANDSGTTIENLSWTANTETDLKDYRIYSSTNAGVTIVSSHVVAGIAAPGTTYQDGGLTWGQRYYFRLTARDVTLNESGGSTELMAVPGPPAAPTGVGAADAPGDLGGALRLSWTAGPEGDLKDYRVYRSTNAGVTQVSTHVVTVVNAPGTTNQDGGLVNGTTYYYRLSARDTMSNESGLSAEVSAAPFSNALAPPAGEPPQAPPTTTVSVSVVIAAAAGGSANLQTMLEPGKETTISGNVLTLASTGVVAGNTIEVKIVNTVATSAPGAGGPALAFELPRISTVVGASGDWSLKTPVLADGSYQIQLRQVNSFGASAWAPDPAFSVKVDAIPDALAVVPAGPNPFRPGAGVSLALGFELAEAAAVSVTIHSEDGALVATLIDGQTLSSGRYTRSPSGSSAVVWDGRSDFGKPAASGVYFCRIKIGDRLFTRKILLLR